MPPAPISGFYRFLARIVFILGAIAVITAAPAVLVQGDWEYGVLLVSVGFTLPFWARLSRN